MDTQLFELKKMILPEAERLAKEASFAETAGACIAALSGLSELARKDGLLAIEALFMGPDETWIDQEFGMFARKFGKEYPLLEQLSTMIVDGFSPENVMFCGTASVLREKDAMKRLINLMILTGILHIQDGASLFVINRILLSLIPESCWEKATSVVEKHGYPYTRRWVRQSDTLKGHMVEVLSMDEINALLAGSSITGRAPIVELEQALKELDDRSIQRLLRDTEIQTLVRALTVMSVAAREKVFKNMSGRLRDMVQKDLCREMRRIELQQYVCAAEKDVETLLNLYKVLKDMGELKSSPTNFSS